MALGAQVSTYFGGTLNVFSAMGSGPKYTVVGFFNDTSGEYPLDSVEVGDIIYVSEGVTCARLRVDTINSSAGGILDADVYDIDTVLLSPPSGIAALLKETPNIALPRYIPGLSENLLACMRTHMTGKVDEEIAAAGDGNGIISALPEDRVSIVSTHSLIMKMDTFNVDAEVQVFRSNNGIPWLLLNDNSFTAKIGDIDDNYEGYRIELENNAGSMFLGNDNNFAIHVDDSNFEFIDNGNGYTFWDYNFGTGNVKIGDPGLSSYASYLFLNNFNGDWGIGDIEDSDTGYKIYFNQGTSELSIGSDNSSQLYIDDSSFRILENANGYGTVISVDSDFSNVKIGDTEQQTHGSHLFIDLSDDNWGIGDVGNINTGVQILHDSGSGSIYVGELSGLSNEQLIIDYSSGITSLGDVVGTSTGMHLRIDNSSTGTITLGDYGTFSNGTKITIDAASETISFNSGTASYGYTFPTTAPGANQVLSEGPTDDNQLVWVDLVSGADGNGLISELPSNPVTIDANGNVLIIDSTGTTRITATGTATGTLVVSGASSLPNTFSHIAGADTAQVNVRVDAGVDLVATRVVSVKADTLNIGDRLKFKATSTGTNELFYSGASSFSVNTRPDGSDAFGLTITGTGSARTINLGDNSGQYFQNKLSINDATNTSTLGGYGVGLRVASDIVTIGDYLEESDYHGIVVDNTNGFIKIGDIHDAEYHFSMHMVPSDHIVTIGDVADNYFSTKLIIDDEEENEVITFNANNGTIFSGSGYTYNLAITNPTANQVMYWPTPTTPAFGSLGTLNPAIYGSDSNLKGNRIVDLDGKTLHATWGTPQNLASNPVDTMNNGLWLTRTQNILGYSTGSDWSTVEVNGTEAKLKYKELDNGNTNSLIKVGSDEAVMRVNNETSGATLTQFTLSDIGYSLNFDGFSVFSGSDADSLMYMYEDKYAFPNEAMSDTLNDKTIMYWTGDGSNPIANTLRVDWGNATGTTDASGDLTVSHNLPDDSIIITSIVVNGTTSYTVSVHTITSTTFKVRFYVADVPAISASVDIGWEAKDN